MIKKYSDGVVQQALALYMSHPTITQKDIAERLRVPQGTVGMWLRHKTRGLTPFQRFKKTRDAEIARRLRSVKNQAIRARERRDMIPEIYGISKNYMYVIARQQGG